MTDEQVILIVDDEKDHADALAEALEKQCANILTAYSADQAISMIENEKIDLVITDLNLSSNINGLDILNHAKAANPSTAVILITAYATIDTCKQAIQQGAYDYMVKPIDLEQLRAMVLKVLPKHAVYTPASDFKFDGIMSSSAAMQRVFHVVRRVAPTNISILIEGESGTGKELLARAVHDNSLRRSKPFKPINCAGFTESLLESELFGHVKGAFTGAASDRKGLFEIADKGTLFLDEIGDMPLNMQAKLLRVIEDGLVLPVGSGKPIVVDVRIISATNHDLAKLVEEKKFRQDLYFRIKGVSITLQPLRNRREDIPELFGYFLKQAAQEIGSDIHRITEPAMSILMAYHWPGNIRQLRHTVRTMVVMCENDTLDVQDIPPDIRRIKQLQGQVAPYPVITQTQDDTSPRSLNEVEKEHIRKTLEITNGNRTEAAKILKIGERTLYRKIKEYDL